MPFQRDTYCHSYNLSSLSSVSHVSGWLLTLQLNSAQTAPANAGKDLNLEPAWIQGCTGKGSIVAVVDDGMHCIIYHHGHESV